MDLREQNVQQVWERVLAQPVQPQDDLEALCQLSRQLSAVYRRLFSGAAGPRRELLRQLYEMESETLFSLRGIQRLSGRPGRRKMPLPGSGELGLESCYHRTCRMAAELTARSAQPEYGLVFRQLAGRCEKQCCLLAQLLGKE